MLTRHFEKKMADKVWLTDTEVGTRFWTTRQWVWVQARTNPKFTQDRPLVPLGLARKAFEQEALAARG